MAAAPDVAILTPTRLAPERMAYLEELHRSLIAQRGTATWEWIIALDGADPESLPSGIRCDVRVRVVALPQPVGTAAARNLALHAASAAWVTSVDDDDILPERSLITRLDASRRESGIHWVAGQLADLHPDGSLHTWICPTPVGCHSPGEVWSYWFGPDNVIPLGPTTLLVQMALLRATGGWAGLPQGEDLGMMCGVTGSAAGYMVDHVVYHYRKWPGQTMRQQNFSALEWQVRQATWLRGQALREVGKSAARAFPHPVP